jgi:hypothetical protein
MAPNKSKLQTELKAWERILERCTTDEEKASAQAKIDAINAQLKPVKPKKIPFNDDVNVDLDKEPDDIIVEEKQKKDPDFWKEVEM